MNSTSSRYGVFPLTEDDRRRFVAHMLRLDSASRYLRFGTCLPDASVEQVALRLPLEGSAWGLFVWGELKGSALLVPVPNEPHRSELALALSPSLRGHGWGTELTESALRAARATGLEWVDVHYVADNTPMARICRRFPGKLERDLGSYTKVVDLAQWEESYLVGTFFA